MTLSFLLNCFSSSSALSSLYTLSLPLWPSPLPNPLPFPSLSITKMSNPSVFHFCCSTIATFVALFLPFSPPQSFPLSLSIFSSSFLNPSYFVSLLLPWFLSPDSLFFSASSFLMMTIQSSVLSTSFVVLCCLYCLKLFTNAPCLAAIDQHSSLSCSAVLLFDSSFIYLLNYF